MDLLDVKTINEAVNLQVKVMEEIPLKKKILLETKNSLGYILASDLVSRDDLPSFRKSTMDGYAIKYKDSQGASDTIPTILRIVEEIEMGFEPKCRIENGEASKIYTGGMLPEGADSVIPIEFTEKFSNDLISINKPIVFMDNVIDIGEDSSKGDLYQRSGKIIDPETIAMAASLGYDKIEAYDKINCKIISTGDEILPVSSELYPAKTRDINSYMLYSLLNSMGINVVSMKHLKDDKEIIRKELLEDIDLIIVSGSSSKGKKDFIPFIAKDLEPGLIYHGISIKPGKPTSLSLNNKTIILGLPGNPISAYTVFKCVFQKAYNRYYNIEDSLKIKCRLVRNIHAKSAKTLIQLVDIERREDELIAIPIFGFSNNISLLKKVRGYILIDEYSEGLRENEYVWVSLIK
ncbi:molybdopterin molybdotransferase MoeA [Anaerococcus porci]|uniref:molybdopterin molybdotransferase MoeA n=1 Tax=Anaerococcus porci TaxID=2652269 RepID=UPI002A759D8E|nr:molybdopterin molybdotransferase MoeA [Anaerococcus porci]MDY3005648.1 molybdopterin molybdotransferase MoeA [Anaerococcus porci]